MAFDFVSWSQFSDLPERYFLFAQARYFYSYTLLFDGLRSRREQAESDFVSVGVALLETIQPVFRLELSEGERLVRFVGGPWGGQVRRGLVPFSHYRIPVMSDVRVSMRFEPMAEARPFSYSVYRIEKQGREWVGVLEG